MPPGLFVRRRFDATAEFYLFIGLLKHFFYIYEIVWCDESVKTLFVYIYIRSFCVVERRYLYIFKLLSDRTFMHEPLVNKKVKLRSYIHINLGVIKINNNISIKT